MVDDNQCYINLVHKDGKTLLFKVP
jgi:hypothetical protein